MKTKQTITTLIAILGIAVLPAAMAEEKHDHAHKEAGPNGGRIVTAMEPHFEFLVMPDRTLKITFLGEDGKPVAMKEQSITAIGGDRANPTKFAFARNGESLVSDKPLPEGTMIPIVIQVKLSPDAKTVTVKFTVNLANCTTCQHQEYACICGH